jgi:V8-like Glu-specific endopeptidase
MDMPLLVPGHPDGEPMMIDVSDECKLTRVEPYDYYDRRNIQHQCDTMGGSSGSPLLDRATGYVIGLHWGAAGDTGSNHAIPMSLILDHLHEAQPAIYERLTVVQ